MKLYKDQLLNLIQTHKKNWQNIIKSEYRFIYNDVLENTPQVFVNSTISTKVYCYLNDITSEPVCKVCGKKLQNTNATVYTGFINTCGKECASRYKHNKTKEAILKKYGVENVYSLRQTHVKSKQTKLRKYGDENYNNPNKNKKTCLEKYGVDNPAKSDAIKKKMMETCFQRYGVEFSFQAEQTKQKIIETSLERYGVENPGGSALALESIKKTLNAEYGPDVNSPGDLLKRDEFKRKRIQTYLTRYGVEHSSKSEKTKFKKRQKSLAKYGCSNYQIYTSYQIMLNNEYDVPMFSLQELDEHRGNDKLLQFKCKRCGLVFETMHLNGMHSSCPKCYPKNEMCGKSAAEMQIAEFIENELGLKLIHNDRAVLKPFEIDMLVADRRIGIEYDGLYYHKFGTKPTSYHLNKTEQCEKNGIQLIHIFENEWVYKHDIVKSRLRNLFRSYSSTVFARKCTVREVDSATAREFLDRTHIQGSCQSKVNLGLFFNDALIALMTFGKARFSKKHDWELLRFSTEFGYHIPGGASKLLKCFERNHHPKSLVSYADRRWSRGKLYEALGFSLDHNSPPNYWYFRNFTLESRLKYQKHKLKKMLEIFDDSKTEQENMIDNGYSIIYDCGNMVFTKEYAQ